MEENDVRLDSHFAQLRDTPIDVLEKFRIESSEIPLIRLTFRFRPALKGVMERLVLAVGVVLRKNAHPQLVEWRMLQRLEGLRRQLVALMHPRVTRGADAPVTRAVGIGEVKTFGDAQRAVIACA